MAVKFLDYTGLGYFWSKIKAWCNATFAAITHNQASNTINAMTGYSKPSTGSALATTDTLNEALGKLEAKVDAYDDSNYVHKTGNETISGNKYFYDIGLNAKSSTYEKGTAPSSNIQVGVPFWDKNNVLVGVVEYIARASGACDTKISCIDPNGSDSSEFAALYVGVDSNGNYFATAPSTSSNRNIGSDIVTRNWIPNDTRIVHITGDETITGNKTFKNNLSLYPSDSHVLAGFLIKNPVFVRGDIPSSYDDRKYMSILFNDASSPDWDPNGQHGRLGGVECSIIEDGQTSININAYKNTLGSTDFAQLAVACPLSGQSYALAPSTPTDRVHNRLILTYDWIPKDTRIVHIDGTEVITGSKVFTENNLYLKSTTTEKNVLPSVNTGVRLSVIDKNSALLGTFEYVTRTNGSSDVKISCIKPNGSSVNDFTALYVGYDANGVAFSTAPSTSSSRSGTNDIVTRDWIPSDTRIVHASGNEEIDGRKAFQADVYFVSSSWTKGTSPSGSNVWRSLIFSDSGTGSAAMAANFIGVVQVGLLTDGTSGMQLTLFKNAANSSSALTLQFLHYSNGTGAFRPTTNSVVALGTSGYRWKEVWCTQSSINSSSDERIKDSISLIPDEVLDAWGEVDFQQYKFKDAIQEKGNNARIHSGLIAQHIDSIFKKHNLNTDKYGFFLYDEWKEEPEEKDENGAIVKKAVTAGNSYGLRYTECLCIEAAYQRRKNKILENRISELEKQVSDMLQILQSLKGAN